MHGFKDFQLPARLDENMFRLNNKKGRHVFIIASQNSSLLLPLEETNNLEKLKAKPVIVYNSEKHDMCIM